MGDKYYLHILLNVVRGATCYEDIRTVDGIEYTSYRRACRELNLLGDDIEWVQSIKDASEWKLGDQLTHLFVTILLFCAVNDQECFLRESLPYLKKDIVYNERRRLQNQDVEFLEEEILNYALLHIDNALHGHNRSLSEFTDLPQINQNLTHIGRNTMILAERTFRVDEERVAFESMFSGLNVQQKIVYDYIMHHVDGKLSGTFFVYGCGGTGKTYLWKTIIAKIRSRGQIVLSVASSGIASLLLPGGRTSHSRFRIPIDIDHESCYAIDVTSELAELIRISELIIWDEAPLQHRHAFEAVDRTFRDIFRHGPHGHDNAHEQVFGGKVVVLSGDFRQILPVIPNGKRADVVASVVNSSSQLSNGCRVFILTLNMRLHCLNIDASVVDGLRQFNNFVLDIGNGDLPAYAINNEDESTWVEIPNDLLIGVQDDPISAILASTYPDLESRLNDIDYLKERCILCPTNDEVDNINLRVLECMEGDFHEMYRR